MKTSLAPGSQVVGEYLSKSGLQKDLDKLGFNLVGFGCTTCIGNSGPLPAEISKAINENDLVAAAVLSGNRNFEGRVNADVRANYLASPPLVVAYAIAGSMQIDVAKAPLGTDQKAAKSICATSGRRAARSMLSSARTSPSRCSRANTATCSKATRIGARSACRARLTFPWDRKSTYVQNPPYFAGMSRRPEAPTDVIDARVLGLFLEFDHHRSHLAGGLDQGGFAGRQVSDRSQGQAGRFQPIRHAARQSRGDDARHLRQYPAQEPNGAGRRRRLHRPLSVAASA